MKVYALVAAAALLPLTAPAARAQTITTLAGFVDPVGVVVDGSGNVFVADYQAGAVKEIVAPGYTTVKTLSGSPTAPVGLALDAGGNLYVAAQSQSSIVEFLAAGGYTSKQTLGSGFKGPTGVAVDSAGNVYVADQSNNQVKKIPAGNGTPVVLGSGFKLPAGVAVDRSGNVFVADTGNSAVKEILAAGGYSTVNTIGSGFSGPTGVALDAAANLYVADYGNSGIKEVLAAGGYTTILPVGIGFYYPQGVGVDGSGNVFISDSGNAVVKEAAVATPVVASVLPGSRSVQTGATATVFANMINASSTALSNCGVFMPITAPAGLSFSYQTTDPNTNALTGSPNTPVTLAANGGSQTFVVTFRDSQAVSAPGMAIAFLCASTSGTQTTIREAAVVPGIDTLDFNVSTTPVPDIIALAATPTNNGLLQIPVNGAGAFAVATDDLGAAGQITASVDTGGASLPLSVGLCQSNPSTGQCQAAPAGSVTLNFNAGSTPTFSVFATANGAIPFNPASNRIFVRFKDASGGLHGSTSIAVQTK